MPSRTVLSDTNYPLILTKAGKSDTPVSPCTRMLPCSPRPQNEHNTRHLASSVKTLADMSYGIEVWGPGDSKSAMWCCGCELRLYVSAVFPASLWPWSFILILFIYLYLRQSLLTLPRLASNLLYLSGWPQPSRLLSAVITALLYQAQAHSAEQNASDVSAVGSDLFLEHGLPLWHSDESYVPSPLKR